MEEGENTVAVVDETYMESLAPEHLEVGNLNYIGHLLGNSMSDIEIGLNAMLVRFKTESCLDKPKPTPEFLERFTAMRKARVYSLEKLGHLFDKYGSDMEKIPGLVDALNGLRKHLEKGQWDLALNAYRDASNKFKLGLNKKRVEGKDPQ